MSHNLATFTELYLCVEDIFQETITEMCLLVTLLVISERNKRRRLPERSLKMINKIPHQIRHLNRVIKLSDADCIVNLRMDRNTFERLCIMLRELGSVRDSRYVIAEEQIAMFLSVLAHHKKNKIVGFDYSRSGQTVSNYFHIVLKVILKLHTQLLVKPDPVSEDNNDNRWKWFKGCLGALDGIYISITVPVLDKPRYRSRKGEICTNVLGVCDRNMGIVYVLPGWEGSASDSRVLRDAVNRNHGLKVPRGNYYLVDNGYANSEGFLAPYRGVRYHLKEWGLARDMPQNVHELFNMRHAQARNVIERYFGIMKKHWGILRSPSFYTPKVHNCIIIACFLLHNFIRSEMHDDPIEREYDLSQNERGQNEGDGDEEVVQEPTDYIDVVETSNEWNRYRESVAEAMWLAY